MNRARALAMGLLAALALAAHGAEPRPGPEAFARDVNMRLEVPHEAQAEYAGATARKACGSTISAGSRPGAHGARGARG